MKHSSLSNYEETQLRASRACTLTPRPPLIVSWVGGLGGGVRLPLSPLLVCIYLQGSLFWKR